MHEGIYIAASAGIKQSKKMEVIAQNLANVNSTGYKKDSLVFKELMAPFEPSSEINPEENLPPITQLKSSLNLGGSAAKDLTICLIFL